jgi:4-hydroxy-4-methyl-2-oxoglutarate aldolase
MTMPVIHGEMLLQLPRSHSYRGKIRLPLALQSITAGEVRLQIGIQYRSKPFATCIMHVAPVMSGSVEEATSMTPEETLAFLRETPTGFITDALSSLGVYGNMTSIWPARGFEDVRLVGPALTIDFQPTQIRSTRALTPYEIYDQAEPGKVVVIAAQGQERMFMGDNQAHMAKSRGMLGFVVDGGVRDVAGIRQLGLPLYYKGAQTRGSEGINRAGAFNVPVVAGGTLVNPDDIIVADEDGVVVIPASLVGNVVELVTAIAAIEEEIDQAIDQGVSMAELNVLLAKKKSPLAKN